VRRKIGAVEEMTLQKPISGEWENNLGGKEGLTDPDGLKKRKGKGIKSRENQLQPRTLRKKVQRKGKVLTTSDTPEKKKRHDPREKGSIPRPWVEA